MSSNLPGSVCWYIQEEDQLIAEWEPEPLVPTEHPSDREVDPAPIVTGYDNTMIAFSSIHILFYANLVLLASTSLSMERSVLILPHSTFLVS